LKEVDMMKQRKKAGLAVILIGWTAMLGFAPAPKYDMDISVQERKIESMSSQGLLMVFHLNLANSSSGPYDLVKYDYRIIVEKSEYLNLDTSLENPIRIESRGSTVVSLPFKVTYNLLFQAIPGLETKDMLLCTFVGGMTFRNDRGRDKRVPMAFSGEFPVFRDLSVKFLPFQAKTLTMGGADLNFRIAFQNSNGFSLNVENLSYKLELRGKVVTEGEKREAIRITGRGENTLAVPLLLDFFEIGKDVFQSFEQPPVLSRFSGKAELVTTWGRYPWTFDLSEKVSVDRVS
jgi:hypothetical protein